MAQPVASVIGARRRRASSALAELASSRLAISRLTASSDRRPLDLALVAFRQPAAQLLGAMAAHPAAVDLAQHLALVAAALAPTNGQREANGQPRSTS